MQQAQGDRRALHIERVIILNHADRLFQINLLGGNLNALPLRFQPQRFHHHFGLLRVLAAAQIEREGAQQARDRAQSCSA